MTKEACTPSHWCAKTMLHHANAWLAKKRLSHRGASEHSLWWDFVCRWPQEVHAWIEDFVIGRYVFSPRIRFHFSDETIDGRKSSGVGDASRPKLPTRS